MMHRLIIASAGAGKSTRIVNESAELAQNRGSVLVVTYTNSNQRELTRKYSGVKPASIKIKGWFTFLLEDLIRPYQRSISSKRINGIVFNQSNPHMRRGNYHIPERKEKINEKLNPEHFITKENKAYTYTISKLAFTINKLTDGNPTKRLAGIYDAIYIDEVQDLVGYDFHMLRQICKTPNLKITCVGDFRQTIYTTSSARKKPIKSADKIEQLKKSGFTTETMDESHRCIQAICSFANLIHEELKLFKPTISNVSSIPNKYQCHLGVFIVNPNNLKEYLEKYHPVILRQNRNTHEEVCEKWGGYTFGVSKGLTFERCLIFPTEKHEKFLKGKVDVFFNDKTEKARNTFYVISTRARYSVAFVCEGDSFIDEVVQWK